MLNFIAGCVFAAAGGFLIAWQYPNPVIWVPACLIWGSFAYLISK